MASSRRTYDTDVITLRTVFAKNVVNSNIPALRVLTADGTGATYWAVPSSLGGIPAFNEMITSAGTYTADLSYNRFRLLAGEGIGMVNGPVGSNQTTLYSKAFSEVDVSGDNAFYAFTSNTVTPNIRFAATGDIQVRADPATNTVFIDGPKTAPYIVSTGIYGFNQIKVTEAASTITSSVQGWSGNFLTANSPSTLLRFIGYNDIQLSTNVTTNSVFFTISSFNSKDYLNISTAAYSAYPNAISTVSSLYTSLILFNSSFNYLSSLNGGSYSTLESTINGIAMSTGTQFYILSGLIFERATIDQLNSEISQVTRNITSTTIGLGTLGYISTGGGSVVGEAQLYSTVTGLGSAGYLSSLQGAILDADIASTLKYSPYFSTVALGYQAGNDAQGINSIAIGNNAASTLQGTAAIALGYNAGLSKQGDYSIAIGSGAGQDFMPPSTIILSALASTLNVANPGFYVAPIRDIGTQQTSLLAYNPSTCEIGQVGIQVIDNVLSTNSIYNTGGISTHSLEVFGPATLTNSGSTILRGPVYVGGQTYFAGNVITSENSGLVNTSTLNSTIAGLGSSSYISTPSLISTTYGLQTSGFLSTTALISTTYGLQTSGFLSTPSLISTTYGLQTSGFLSTTALISTTYGLQTSGFLSTTALISTTYGLQTSGFLSTPSLISTTYGLQTSGFLSTPSLISTTYGLQTSGFLSTPSLISTTYGLQTSGFLSTPSLISTTYGLQTSGFLSTTALISTTYGLQTSGFLSTTALISTTYGLQTSGFLSTATIVSTGASYALLISTQQLETSSIRSFFISSLALNVSSINGALPGSGSGAGNGSSLTVSTGQLYASSMSFVNMAQTNTNLWVAIGQGATAAASIQYSTDGISWLNSLSGGFASQGFAVAWNGRLWVAVGGGSLTTTIQYSSNGINWTSSSSGGFNNQGRGVAWNGRIWVAVGNYGGAATGSIQYSTDGITWNPNSSGGFTTIGYGVAWNGEMWVAVGQGGTTIQYSRDGTIWTGATGVTFSSYGFGVAWNGTLWVAVGNGSGTTTIKYSSDGINWTNSSSGGFSIQGHSVAWNGRMWVAVGYGGANIQYSFDGINWTSAASSFATYGFYVAWNGRLWVAVGGTGSAAGSIKYSTDGINWTNSSSGGFSGEGNGIAYSANLIPSYNQTNFEIEPQNIPVFLRSTNTMSFLPSTIIANNTLFIDTTNKVGINTGNPSTDLDVNGTIRASGISTIFFQTSSFVTAIVSSLSFQTSSFVTPIVSTLRTQTSSLTFGSGIGWVTAGAFQAVVVSSIQLNTALGYVSSLYVGSTNSVTLPFYTANINGQALIKSLLVGQPLNPFSTTGFSLAITSDSAVKPGSATWTTTSDMRVKENIVNANVDQCYSDIKSLALRRFTWESNFIKSWDGEDKRVLGFVAQEVSSIMPKSVKVMPAYGYSDFQFINTDQLNMALFGAVKKTIADKEVLESTVKGQTFELETLRGTTTFILSTLRGLQNQ